MADHPRVLFLGMFGAFSRAVCEAALDAGANVYAVIVPGSGPAEHLLPASGAQSRLPILTPYVEQNIVHLAWERDIPVFADSNVTNGVALAGVQPDILAVACWPRIIPRSVRELARLAVNVHPSLLPENRGPEPLFWTFRLGLARTGVTVHLLEDRADAGPILAQRELPVPNGINGADLELELARAGGELLARVAAESAAGPLRPVPQDESRATYHPAPRATDWQIPDDWPEERRHNFVAGVAHLRRSQKAP